MPLVACHWPRAKQTRRPRRYAQATTCSKTTQHIIHDKLELNHNDMAHGLALCKPAATCVCCLSISAGFSGQMTTSLTSGSSVMITTGYHSQSHSTTNYVDKILIIVIEDEEQPI